MKITKESDYAIRIVDYLTRKGSIVRSSEIAEEASVPLRFAKNILQKLVHRGIINSFKGSYGGYELRRSPEDISLYDVLEATEELAVLNVCQNQGYECAYMLKGQCMFHKVFKGLSKELEDNMRKVRFSEITHNNVPES